MQGESNREGELACACVLKRVKEREREIENNMLERIVICLIYIVDV